MSKAKGHEDGARRYLAASHAAGHAHASVVRGEYGGGTHERGLQPVAAGHLKRERHITAAFNPDTRKFGLQDPNGRQGFSPEVVTTSIPEHLGEHFNAKNYKIVRLAKTDGGHRVTVETPSGDLKSFNANGSDLHQIDPHVVTPTAAPAGADTHIETHTVKVSQHGVGGRKYGVIKPTNGHLASIDIFDAGVAQHILDNHHKVIGYERKTITTVGPDGTIRRYKANGSNLAKPTIVKNIGSTANHEINGWAPLSANVIPQSPGLPALSSYKVRGGVYRKGNKTVVLEPNMTDNERAAFLGHVDQAFEATKQHTGHEVTIHVPSGDRVFSRGRTQGYVYRGDSTRVHIAPSVAKASADAGLRGSHSAESDWLMSSAKDVHPTLHTITHELGHIVDNKNGHTYGMVTRDANGGFSAPLVAKPEAAKLHRELKVQGGLSTYGSSSPVEGYAEAFAHHHLADRGTQSSAKHDIAGNEYASRYGWTPRLGWRGVTNTALIQAVNNGDQAARAEAKRRGLLV